MGNVSIVDPARSLSIRALAVVALLCFAPVTVTFAIAPGAWWADYPGILFHLAMFLLVAKLDAPDWAKSAGYGWLVLDVMTAVLTLNHVPHAIADYVRLGGHIFGGIWIAVASLSCVRATRLVGLVSGLWLAGYSFLSPVLPMTAVAPASLLLLVWLALLAWRNGGRPVQTS